VLAKGVHLTTVSINALNPYGPKFGPPGTSTLTVMPLPSSSVAHTADIASNAAFAAP